MAASLAALIHLTQSNFTHNNLTRNLELARAIDSIAMVTAAPEHVQQFVESSVPTDAGLSIRVIDQDGQRIMAASDVSEFRSKLSALGDAEVTSIAAKVFKTGQFNAEYTTPDGRRFTILPLTSARHTLAGNFVLQQARVLTPAWHGKVRLNTDNPLTWLERLSQKHQHVINAKFTLPRTKFSGVIIIENRQQWVTSMLSDQFLGFTALIFAGFLLVMTSGWYFVRTYVMKPVNELSDVMRQQRKGNDQARAPRSSVREFDHLARQWNGLLNYRQSAEARQRVLSKVLEYAPISIEVTDPNELIEYANPAFLEMTGYSLIEVLGKSPGDLTGNENADHDTLRTASSEAGNGRVWHGQFPSRRKDGTEFISEVTLHPIMTEDNQLERIVAVRQDVTVRKAYEESLIEAKRVSEDAERSKSEFIARMSHELRTPFNSIIGYADIIAKQQLGPVGNDTYLEFARIIEQSATGLLAIINSIIDLSRMAAGQRPLDEVSVNLLSLVAGVVRSNLKDEDKDRISVNINDKLNVWALRADERLVEQLLSNLVSNAIKFNRDGGQVDISLRRDRQSRIIIEVKDTGIGMSKSDLKLAFKPFNQVQSTYDRQYEGIGLGLTLAENQAAVHDADLKISSRKGHGTKVKIIFPSYRTVKLTNTRLKQTKPANNSAKAAKAA
ncbi:MAG: PAS domain-containing sensor histidine kinase [Rhizobiales bacterium]|nr:PAS domain-containing sensor histidine kinase [Hyphomicrobiales bacterium]